MNELKNSFFKKNISFFIYFIILFIYSLIVIFYRNHMVADFYKSYTEAINNSYTDWHPVIFTLIFAKLPILIFGESPKSTFIFYELIRSIILGFAIFNIEKFTINENKKNFITKRIFAIISLLYYMFMPLSLHSIASQTKGTAMGEFFIVAFVLILRRIYNKDKNLSFKRINIENIIIGVFIALSVLMRKNGILFFVPFLVGVFFNIPRKDFIKIIFSIIITILLVTKVIYSFFTIENLPKAHNKHEMLGLPLTVISSFMKYDISDVDSNTYQFAKELVNGDLSLYDGFDIKLGYNTVRWNPNFDLNNAYDVLSKYDTSKILKMSYGLIKKNPSLGIKTIFNLTKGVYGFRNWQGITKASGKILDKNLFLNIYQFFLSIEVAFTNYFVIITIFIKKLLLIKRKDDNEIINKIFKLCLSLSILIYAFGTMLLLSSSDSVHYFMINSMIMPLYILSVYSKGEKYA